MMICKSVDIKMAERIEGGVHSDGPTDKFCSAVCRNEMNGTKNCTKVNNGKMGITIIFSVGFYLPETSVLVRLGSDIRIPLN
jgi:hypothetical protein